MRHHLCSISISYRKHLHSFTCKLLFFLIPLLLLVNGLGWRPAIAKDAVFMFDGKILLSSMVSLVDGYLRKMADSFEVLAMTNEVQSGKWEEMKALLDKAQQRNIHSLIWYARTDGSYFTVDKGLVNKNIKDRDYFSKLLAGEEVFGTIVVSRSTGRNVTVVAVPIKKGGNVIGVLGASIYLDRLNEIVIQEMKLPEDFVFFVIDANAKTVLNWKEERIFKNPAQQGSESLSKAINEMLSKKEGMAEYEFEGTTKKVIYQTSPLTGWKFAIGKIMK